MYVYIYIYIYIYTYILPGTVLQLQVGEHGVRQRVHAGDKGDVSARGAVIYVYLYV